MPTRKSLLIFAIAVTVALLVGYVPQFLRARGLNQDLQACQAGAQMSELRDAMGLAYLEANQKNYGLAAQHAARFFERASRIREEMTDAGIRGVLEEALKLRDEITAGLARGDAAVLDPLQRVYRNLLKTAPPVAG